MCFIASLIKLGWAGPWVWHARLALGGPVLYTSSSRAGRLHRALGPGRVAKLGLVHISSSVHQLPAEWPLERDLCVFLQGGLVCLHGRASAKKQRKHGSTCSPTNYSIFHERETISTSESMRGVCREHSSSRDHKLTNEQTDIS